MSVTAIPARGSADPLEAFYVPAFTLTRLQPNDEPKMVVVQGALKPDILHDIESVTYTDNLEEADSFSLTINNWDALGLKGKYFGLKQKPTGTELEWAELFKPGQRFELKLGYLGQPDHMRLMMRGYVTGVDVTFPQSASPTLKVEAQDASRKLNDETYSWRWPPNKTDSEIAKELAQPPNKKKGKPGLDFPVKTSDQAAANEARHPVVVMRRQKIMDFLLERAKRHAYSVFRMIEDGKEKLYFGPSELLPDGPYTLEWGKTLLEFKPVLKTAKQAKEVVVRGWDRGDRKRLEGKAVLDDVDLNKDLFSLLEPLGEKKEIVDKVLRTKDEAKELARATIAATLKSVVEATGATVGLPDLRAGQAIRITGVDYRLDGRYFLTQTVHTLDSNGYRTTFKARREHKGATRG
jgi:phage protein D